MSIIRHLISCWLLCLVPINSIAQTLALTNTEESLHASFFVSLLEDPTHALSIAQVSSSEYTQRFQPNPHPELNLGRSPSAWWLRLEIEQHSSNIWHLLIDFPGIAQADAFAVNQSTHQITPLGSLLKEQAWQRLPIVSLPTQPGRFSLYIRASNNGKGILAIPIQLLSADALIKKTAKDYLFYGGIIIGLIVLAFYNFSLFISLRNWDYLTLIVFLLSLALVLQRMTNVIPYLSLSNPAMVYYPITLQVIAISATQFCRQLIDTKTLFPRTNRVLTAVLIFAIGITPFVGLLPYTDLWSFLLSAGLTLIGSVLGLLALRQGSRIMRSFAVAFFVFLGCAAPLIMWGMGFLKDAQTIALIDLFHIGSLLIAILLSLTLAEHTRQLRIQAERATAASQAKDDFLITMSHELRTPMNSVIAATTLLQQDTLPPRQQEYVTCMQAASHHMLGLIDNILDLSRMAQAPPPSLTPEFFHLHTLLEGLHQMLDIQADAKKLPLHLYKPAQQNLHLLGDPKRLSQVLINLLGNALKFTEHGKVELHVKEASQPNCNLISLYFEVSDTGIGISRTDQQRLFQPFTQVESHRTRQHTGSGLGLAISHKLVEAMGGKLELESTPGKGSRFFFTLPFPLHLPTEATSLKPIPPKLPPNKHILLVDDDPMNQFFGRELLQTLGATVSVAASGTEAIQQIQQQSFDLVFMDVSMPGMDGYETTQKIRFDPNIPKLPIVALTAHAIAGERERCLAAGMNDYLTKPISLEGIRQMIYQWTASTP
ncbi:ATP-binding protein [Thiothrix lacustris]|uniref:histidine kinase n=1 Tax=Thiothrix lacustris TaxID=525917 RepID=A0ABY9MMB6_9GAMM|nr:ATP-binding protein [Thiothrix lacustris]WML89482.1 ATP-binding protein [Thiothrix lacustris]